MTAFAIRHTRLVAALLGVAAGLAAAGLGVLTLFAIDLLHGSSLAVTLIALFVGLFVVLRSLGSGFVAFVQRMRGAAPRDFSLGRYRGRPAYVTANELTSMPPFLLFLPGMNLAATIIDQYRPWPSLIFMPLLIALWAWSLLQPSFLRLTPDDLVGRRRYTSRRIPWETIHEGTSQTHRDQDGGLWVLADSTIPEHKDDRMTGRPDGPPGYHWVRVCGQTLIDQSFLEHAIRSYRQDPQARSLIGTAEGLDALRATA